MTVKTVPNTPAEPKPKTPKQLAAIEKRKETARLKNEAKMAEALAAAKAKEDEEAAAAATLEAQKLANDAKKEQARLQRQKRKAEKEAAEVVVEPVEKKVKVAEPVALPVVVEPVVEAAPKYVEDIVREKMTEGAEEKPKPKAVKAAAAEKWNNPVIRARIEKSKESMYKQIFRR